MTVMTEVKVINVTCHPVIIKLTWQLLQLGQTNWFPSHQIPNILLQYLQSVVHCWVSSHIYPTPLISLSLMFFPILCLLSHESLQLSDTFFSLHYYSSVLLSGSLLALFASLSTSLTGGVGHMAIGWEVKGERSC